MGYVSNRLRLANLVLQDVEAGHMQQLLSYMYRGQVGQLESYGRTGDQ